MRSVGIKLLKNKLSEYIRLAAGGETVLVTDRDRLVAELGPPAPGRSPLVSDALLLDAVRQGWISLLQRSSAMTLPSFGRLPGATSSRLPPSFVTARSVAANSSLRACPAHD